MRKLREILSVGTMLPTLLLSNPGLAAPIGPDQTPTVSGAALRLAQAAPAAPDEDPRHKRPVPGTPPAPGAAPTRPVAPPVHVAPPAAPVAPPVRVAPPAAPVAPPVRVAPPAAPVAPPVHVAPPAAPVAPPVRIAPPAAPAPGGVTPMAPQGAAAPPVHHRDPAAAPTAAPSAPPVTPVAPPPAATPAPAPAAAPVPSAPPAAAAPAAVPAPAVAVPTAPAPAAAPAVRVAPPAAPAAAVPATPPAAQMAPQGAGAPPHQRHDPVAPGAPGPGGLAPHAPGAPGVGAAPAPMPGQIGRPDQRPPQPGEDRRSGISPLGAAAVGAAVGVVGGMILGGQPAQGLHEVQSNRREVRDGNAMIYSEPGRVIVRDADGLRLRHDETERFRELGGDIRTDRRGDEIFQVYDRPDGVRIITVTDADGRLIRRIRRAPDGREVVLIDNGASRRTGRWGEERLTVAPPVTRLSRDVYEVDAGRADGRVLYDTLEAPPLAPLDRRYTLDEVRYNRDLRSYMRSVDVDTLTFESGSWTVSPDQYDRLAVLAGAIDQALRRNPDEIFLVEGHSDAVGSDIDNLSLSDRRAQSVAATLTREFRIPAENLVTQGYGEQFLKVSTDGPARENRRVTLRRITPLIAEAR